MAADPATNLLYFGDNLDWLRRHASFPDESIDLIYLDPPFNSNRSYNVLFKESDVRDSEAQIHAFEDTWAWDKEGRVQDVFNDFMVDAPQKPRDMLKATVTALGHNDVTAYLTMMAPRLLELHRVLSPTGSLYLHCDPTASHYLKILLDATLAPSGSETRSPGSGRIPTTTRSGGGQSPIRSSTIARDPARSGTLRGSILIPGT